MKDIEITQRIKTKYPNGEDDKIISNLFLNLSMPSEEEIEKQVQEVFDRVDFKRHVIETANELGISEKVCEKVIKHYIRSVVGFFYKVDKSTTRIVIYTIFRITFTNNSFNVNSNYYYKKHPLLISPNLRKRINKILKKHSLKR